ncbi:MAG: hypothetical protein WAZ18_03385 [Alphaproteobacteria bacterium]
MDLLNVRVRCLEFIAKLDKNPVGVNEYFYVILGVGENLISVYPIVVQEIEKRNVLEAQDGKPIWEFVLIDHNFNHGSPLTVIFDIAKRYHPRVDQFFLEQAADIPPLPNTPYRDVLRPHHDARRGEKGKRREVLGRWLGEGPEL